MTNVKEYTEGPENVRFPSAYKKVSVWWRILNVRGWNMKTGLVFSNLGGQGGKPTAEMHIDEMVEAYAVPHARLVGRIFMLMHFNVRLTQPARSRNNYRRLIFEL
jgi:hypothetical protein